MVSSGANSTRQDLLRQLSRRLQQMEQAARPNRRARISSGCRPLDRLLPGGGFSGGTLVEWIAAAPGGGATYLALIAARQACQTGGALAVLDRQRVFYPPAAAACGIDLERLILVRPDNDRDEFWALHQLLGCRHVSATLAWPRQIDPVWFRRLQLAAETGGGLGLLVRRAEARHQPSWADVRLWISPVAPQIDGAADPLPADAAVETSLAAPPPGTSSSWRLRVQLLRCRGRFDGETVDLEIDEQTGAIDEAIPCDSSAQLASATADQRPARA